MECHNSDCSVITMMYALCNAITHGGAVQLQHDQLLALALQPHICSTCLLASNVDLPYVSDLSGHTQSDTTLWHSMIAVVLMSAACGPKSNRADLISSAWDNTVLATWHQPTHEIRTLVAAYTCRPTRHSPTTGTTSHVPPDCLRSWSNCLSFPTRNEPRLVL